MADQSALDPPPIDDSIKHLCSLNFSIFTQKLQDMRGDNRPKDKHGIIRKKWLRVIRGAMKTDGVQTLITYLYAAKTHIHKNQTLTKVYFNEWRRAAGEKNSQKKLRRDWQQLSRLIRIKEYRNREVKLRECRASLAAEFILAQPQFKKPQFGLFLKQLKPLEIDEPPPPQEMKIETVVEEPSLNETEIKEPPAAEIIIPPVQAREASVKEESKEEELLQSPVAEVIPPSPKRTPRKKRILEEVSTEPIVFEEPFYMKLAKRINFKYLFAAIGLFAVLAFCTFHLVHFFYVRLGYYDNYAQFLFNETMPPYNPYFDVDYLINYSEILVQEKDLSIDVILQKMAKEINSMKRKQTEMSDQIEEMHKSILNEDL